VNFGTLFRALDAAAALREIAQRFKGQAPPPRHEPSTSISQSTAVQGLAGQIESRLTSVMVAALKEAFDRDHARLELERAQIEEQRRRAEEALRLELRRQNVERELGRLRLMAGAALVGWIMTLLLFASRVPLVSPGGRIALGVGWLLLLAALGAAFQSMGRASREALNDGAGTGSPAAALPMWLLIGGLALTALSLLI
jgi:hypothetical protein